MNLYCSNSLRIQFKLYINRIYNTCSLQESNRRGISTTRNYLPWPGQASFAERTLQPRRLTTEFIAASVVCQRAETCLRHLRAAFAQGPGVARASGSCSYLLCAKVRCSYVLGPLALTVSLFVVSFSNTFLFHHHTSTYEAREGTCETTPG